MNLIRNFSRTTWQISDAVDPCNAPTPHSIIHVSEISKPIHLQAISLRPLNLHAQTSAAELSRHLSPHLLETSARLERRPATENSPRARIRLRRRAIPPAPRLARDELEALVAAVLVESQMKRVEFRNVGCRARSGEEEIVHQRLCGQASKPKEVAVARRLLLLVLVLTLVACWLFFVSVLLLIHCAVPDTIGILRVSRKEPFARRADAFERDAQLLEARPGRGWLVVGARPEQFFVDDTVDELQGDQVLGECADCRSEEIRGQVRPVTAMVRRAEVCEVEVELPQRCEAVRKLCGEFCS